MEIVLKGRVTQRVTRPFFVFKRMPDGAFAVWFNQKRRCYFVSFVASVLFHFVTFHEEVENILMIFSKHERESVSLHFMGCGSVKQSI